MEALSTLLTAATHAIGFEADILLYFWPVSVAALAVAFWGFRRLVQSDLLLSMPVLGGLGVCIAYNVVMPLYTAVFQANPDIYTPSSQSAPLNGMVAISVLSLAMLLISVLKAGSHRFPLLGAIAPFILLGLSAYFVAAMAISGVWL